MKLFTINSHLSEIFLSFAILVQLLFISVIIRKKEFNSPILTKEIQIQSLLVLIFVFFIYMIFYFAESFIILDKGMLLSKIVVIFFSIILFFLVEEALQIQRINFAEFYSMILLALLSLLIMLDVDDLLLFYLTMETQTLCFYVLASINRGNIFSIEAGLKYFISGAFMSAVFLLGVSLIYGCFGTINLTDLRVLLSIPFFYENFLSIDNMLISNTLVNGEDFLLVYLGLFGILLVIATLLFKLAAFPFHFWMPDVYEGSPLASTVVFTILPKFSLVYFLLKFLVSIDTFADFFSFIFLIFGLLSTLIGTLYALMQVRIKRMILYSSIAQIGFIVSGLAVQTNNGFSSILFFVIIYIVTSIIFWGFLVMIYKSQSNYNIVNNIKYLMPLELSEFSEILSSNKMWFFSFSVMFFSIAGIPPFAGFISKFFILDSLVSNLFISLAAGLLIISAISVFYYIRILKISFFEGLKNNDYVYDLKVNLRQFLDYSYSLSIFILFLVLLLILIFVSPNFLYLTCQNIILTSFVL